MNRMMFPVHPSVQNVRWRHGWMKNVVDGLMETVDARSAVEDTRMGWAMQDVIVRTSPVHVVVQRHEMSVQAVQVGKHVM